MTETDLLIIGGGPAGYVAAIRAAQNGLKVILAEANKVGGTCLNIGCIPTKCFLSYSEAIYSAKKPRKGIEVKDFLINKSDIYSEKDAVVDKLTTGIEQLLKSYGVELKKEKASFVSSTEVKIGDDTVKFKNAIIATGSKSIIPKALFVEGFTVDSTHVLNNYELGKKVVIVGGGVIGCELAFVLNSMDIEVTIIEKLKGILPTEDRDCVRYVESSLKNKGVKIFTDVSVEKIEKGKLSLSNGDTIEADTCVVAIGRGPNTEGLDLEKAGIKKGDKGQVLVDTEFSTNVTNIYAVGDVTGSIQLAHYASACALNVVAKIAKKGKGPNLNVVPRVTYSIPELASVGLTETQIKEQGIEYKIGRFSYSAMGKAIAMGETEGFVKVMTDSNDKLLGACIVGKDADNLMIPFTMAMALNLTCEQLTEFIYPHPTLSEIILEACEDVHGKAIHKGRKRT